MLRFPCASLSLVLSLHACASRNDEGSVRTASGGGGAAGADSPAGAGPASGGQSAGGAAAASGGALAGFGAASPVSIEGYDGDAMEPFISKDGQYLFFNDSNDASVNPDTNLHYALREADDHFLYQGPLVGANSTALDAVASLDEAGNFYFVSVRDYQATTGFSTLYRGEFSQGTVSNVELIEGLSTGTLQDVNFDAEISADGMSLWFVDGTLSNGAVLSADLVVAERQVSGGFVRRIDTREILGNVNTTALEYAPSISVDGLELFFTRVATDGQSVPSIWRASREAPDQPFTPPSELDLGGGFIEAPSLSRDGRSLYFHRDDGQRFALYRATR